MKSSPLDQGSRLDFFLTLLAGLPLLVSGLFTSGYVSFELLTHYRPALWIAWLMSLSLVYIGAAFCWSAWRRRQRGRQAYHQLFQRFPQLKAQLQGDHPRDFQAGSLDLGLILYQDVLIICAQGLAVHPLTDLVGLGVGQHQPRRSRPHLFVYLQLQGQRHEQIYDLGPLTTPRQQALEQLIQAVQAAHPQLHCQDLNT